MKARASKKSSRELRRLAAQRRDHAWRMMGDAARIAYTGANVHNVLIFLDDYGCTADVIDQHCDGQRYTTIVVKPVGLVVKPGQWLIRILRYAIDDKRGWRTCTDAHI